MLKDFPARAALRVFLLALLTSASAFAQANLTGPDGRLYPDFRRAGARPEPRPALVVPVSAHGGLPDDDGDDTAALRAAIAEVAAKGGGTVRLEAGRYLLSEPLCVTSDLTWIQGAGRDRTTIEFTYGLEPRQIRFVGLKDGDRVGLDTTIEVHAYPGPGDSTYPDKAPPGQLKSLSLLAGGRVIALIRQGEGGPFRLSRPLWRITTNGGPLELSARAEWTDGKSSETSLSIEVDPVYLPDRARRLPQYEAAFTFVGDEWTHRSWYRWPLAEDAPRGATRIRPARGEDMPRAKDLPFIRHGDLPPAAAQALRPGDSVTVTVFPTPEWKKATGNSPDFVRSNYARVAAVEGESIVLDRPLRIDFPVAEKARLDARFPIRGSGVEGFTLRQTRRLWTHGVLFQFAEDCVARDIRVLKAGRSPVAIENSLQIEVADSEFEDGWYQIGGGTSYLGTGSSFDCLIRGVRTRALRHAPLVNWSSAGIVFSDSTFVQSDANWHSGWCHENLVENCRIDAAKGSGSYGYGIYTSRPDGGHGATGPRNVFWNNDIVSPQTGAYLGGGISGTVIAHNRFVVGGGPGVEALAGAIGTVLLNNVFVLRAPTQPLFKNHRSGEGWVVVDNRVFGGNGNLTIAGSPPRAEESGNRFGSLAEGEQAGRPSAPAPSLREWQLKQHPLR